MPDLRFQEASAKPHVVVIGGGICGAYAAYWLSRLGASVTVVDGHLASRTASACNPGGLNPLHGAGIPGPMQALALESFQLHLDAWKSVKELSGIEFGGRRTTRLAVALEEDEADALRDSGALYSRTAGFGERWLDGDEARSIEPRLSPKITGALQTEGDARVDAARYLDAVSRAGRRLGVERVARAVKGLDRSGDQATAVRMDPGSTACDAVIVATGPWTEEAGRWLGVRLPVTPVKGDLLLVRPDGGGPAADVARDGAAIYDCGGALAWLGGTETRAEFDLAATPEARDAILSGVTRIWPGMDRVEVLQHVTALRPVSADGLPIVGPCPGWGNVYLALGAGRKGMLLSAGIGRAMAELAASGTTSLSIGPCLAERLNPAPVAELTP